MTTNRKRVTGYLNDTLYTKLKEFCKLTGLSESRAVEILLREALESGITPFDTLHNTMDTLSQSNTPIVTDNQLKLIEDTVYDRLKKELETKASLLELDDYMTVYIQDVTNIKAEIEELKKPVLLKPTSEQPTDKKHNQRLSNTKASLEPILEKSDLGLTNKELSELMGIKIRTLENWKKSFKEGKRTNPKEHLNFWDNWKLGNDGKWYPFSPRS